MVYRWCASGCNRLDVPGRLATCHTVIAADYGPVLAVAEFLAAFDAILRAESVDTVALVGESYCGMLAQAYLAHHPGAIERLVLSSTGPADYGRGWLPIENLLVLLAKVPPEKLLKELVASGLVRLPSVQRLELADLIRRIVRERLCRAEVVSHFAVAADVICTQIVTPAAFVGWSGRILVLTAETDPTRSSKEFPRYERLFGRSPEVISLGQLGHAAALT